MNLPNQAAQLRAAGVAAGVAEQLAAAGVTRADLERVAAEKRAQGARTPIGAAVARLLAGHTSGSGSSAPPR